jgi:hypothetical protein
MTQVNTGCKKCYFAKPATSDNPCSFFIVDAIKDIKTVSVVDDFYYIKDYQCRYGVSTDTVENKLTEFDIDITEYVKQQAAIKYTLYVKILDPTQLEQTCDNILRLSILPQSLNIVVDNSDNIVSTKQLLEDRFRDSAFKWKLHNFLEDQSDENQLHTSLCTDKNLTLSHYLWITNDKILSKHLDEDSINNLNYILNINQPKLALLTSKLSDKYFYGLFISLNNIQAIWKQQGKNISEIIANMYPASDIQYYD